MISRDYYKILNVSEEASQDEIKKNFRKLAQECHPDVNPDDKIAEVKFKELNEAYQVLKDVDKRIHYDSVRKNQFFGEYRNPVNEQYTHVYLSNFLKGSKSLKSLIFRFLVVLVVNTILPKRN